MLENCCWIYANDFSIFVFIIFFPLSASSRVYYAFGLFVYRLVVVDWAVCFLFCFSFEGELTALATGFGSAYYLHLTELRLRQA